MKNYWFKKNKGKGGSIPTTWQGGLMYVLVIGLITQVHNFVNGALQAGVAAAIIAMVGFWFMNFKTDPIESYDREKDKLNFKQIILTVVSIIVIIIVALGIGKIQIDRKHATIGYPVRLENEPDWFEFNSIKDNFIVQLTSYPKYEIQSIAIPNTDVTIKTSSYISKIDTKGELVIAITYLPEGGDYSDIDALFSNGINGIKDEMARQANVEPTLVSSETKQFLTYPSKSFTIDIPSKNSKFSGILILKGSELYSLGYGTDLTQYNENDYNRFINSLRFEQVVKK